HTQGQQDVRDKDTREKEKTHAGGQYHTAVEARTLTKSPAPIPRSNPAEQYCSKRKWNARSPVVHTKNKIRDCDKPIWRRGLLHVRHAVKLGDYPITRLKHVAGQLRVGRVHIIHEAWGRYHASKKNRSRNEQQQQFRTPEA